MGDTTKNLGDTSINRSKHWELLQIVVYNVLLLQTSGQSTWKLCNLTGFTQLETNYKIGLQVTRVNSCGVFDRSRQWSEQELGVSWSSISKDSRGICRKQWWCVAIWVLFTYGALEHGSNSKIPQLKNCTDLDATVSVTLVYTILECPEIPISSQCTNLQPTSHLTDAPEMCRTAVEEWLAPYINHIFTILAILTVL